MIAYCVPFTEAKVHDYDQISVSAIVRHRKENEPEMLKVHLAATPSSGKYERVWSPIIFYNKLHVQCSYINFSYAV